jgi:hypothetical protein
MDLIAAIEGMEAAAERFGDLREERSKALDYYYGRPFGNEVEGRSQVVSKDVADIIGWQMPALMKIFTATDEVVSFRALGPDDQQAAEQESQYINNLVMNQNGGFLTIYEWFKDALLSKNGYVIAYWDESEQVDIESYEGLLDDEFAMIAQADDVEIAEHAQTVEPMLDPFGQVVGQIVRHDVKLKKKRSYGCVKIDGIPPESVFVDPDHKSVRLEHCNFVEWICEKTLSELRAAGFDVDDDLSDAGTSDQEDYEQQSRERHDWVRDSQTDHVDPSMRRVKVREGYIRLDRDGDGIAELLHFVVVGTTILSEEPADMIPIAALTPDILPHQHYGQSSADESMDIQLIKSTLLRGMLDNLYLANNGRTLIGDRVNLDDMLQARPGGVIRVDGDVGGAYAQLEHPTIAPLVQATMEYLDQVLEDRTGVGRTTPGMEADALRETATKTRQLQSMRHQKTELIARIFAETGVTDLFRIVHALTLKHSRQAEIVQLRGKYVQIDPRTWKKRTDLVPNVGLGSGDREMQSMVLQQLLGAMFQVMPMGIAQPKQIYNAMSRLVQNAGFMDTSEFLVDPETLPPPPPPPPPPELQIEQMRIQGRMQEAQMDAQTKMQIEQARAQQQMQIAQLHDATKLRAQQGDLQLQASNDKRDGDREMAVAQMNAILQEERLANDRAIAQMREEMAQFRAMLDAAVKLRIADKPEEGLPDANG